MVDLTTLEGMDTDGKVRSLCAKALHPDPTDPTCPAVAAVCVYGDLVATTRACVADRIHVAAVATAFPSGRASMEVKLMDTKQAVADGADEIDMVIDRGAFLAGNYAKVFEEIVAVKESCGDAHLKVILETGELKTYDNVSSGPVGSPCTPAPISSRPAPGRCLRRPTLPVTLLMLEAVRDFGDQTGTRIGVKAAGGIKTSKDAIRYLVMVNETVGEGWLNPDMFRFGASSLLNDLLMQRQRMRDGHYSGPDYVTID